MSRQSRRMSFVESLVNVGVGFGVAVLTQTVVFPLFGLHATIGENVQIGAIFTVVSVARSFVLRRLFVSGGAPGAPGAPWRRSRRAALPMSGRGSARCSGSAPDRLDQLGPLLPPLWITTDDVKGRKPVRDLGEGHRPDLTLYQLLQKGHVLVASDSVAQRFERRVDDLAAPVIGHL
jgi:hypothetical protein